MPGRAEAPAASGATLSSRRAMTTKPAGRVSPALPARRADHGDRGDDIGMTVENRQPRRRCADSRGVGNGRRRQCGHLEERASRGVEDRDEIGDPLEGDGGETRRDASGQGRPVALGDAVHEGRVSREQPRLAVQRSLGVGHERGRRLLGARRRLLPREREMAEGDCDAARAQRGERQRAERDAKEKIPCRGAHEGSRASSGPTRSAYAEPPTRATFPDAGPSSRADPHPWLSRPQAGREGPRCEAAQRDATAAGRREGSRCEAAPEGSTGEAYSCTLSLRPRAPTKQMGPYRRPLARGPGRPV